MYGFSNSFGIKNINEAYFNAFTYKKRGDLSKSQVTIPSIESQNTSSTQAISLNIIDNLSPTMPIAILLSDLDYKVQFISKSIENVLGYSKEEFYQLSLSQQFEEFTVDAIKNYHEVFLKEKKQAVAKGLEKAIQMRHKNGSFIWAKTWVNATIDKNGNPTGFIGILHRVNDSIANETELNSYVHFQKTLLSLAQRFINIDKNDYHQAFQSLLEELGKTINADRSHIFIHNREAEFTCNSYEWTNSSTSAEIQNLQEVPFQLYQPILDTHKEGKPYICTDTELLKSSHPELYEHLIEQDIRAFIKIPLLKNDIPIGTIGFDRTQKVESFSDFEIELLQIAAEIVTNAIAKQDYLKRLEHEEIQKQQYITEIEHQKQKLENIINAINAGTWECNIQTGKTILNENWANIIGYKWADLGETSISSWEKLVHPDDLANVNAALSNYFAGRNPIFDVIYRLKHKNGSWVWINAIGQLLNRDEFGNPKTMFGIHLDVTIREQAIQKLTQSEERFRFAFHNSLATMYIIDPRTQQFEDVNNTALEFYGYTREEFFKLCLTDINITSKEEIVFEIQHLIRDGKRKFEFKHRLANGEIRDVEVYSSVIFTDNLPYLHSIIIDVTLRKRVQETLTTSLKEVSSYKFALDQAALVSMTDVKGKIIFANERFCSLVGYTQEELIGNNHRIIQSGYHSSEFYKELWVTVLQGNVWMGHVKNQTKNGDFWWADTTIIPFKKDNGKVHQLMAIRFDITKQKENELELFERNQFIESTIINIPIGICVFQLSTGLVTLLNPTLYNILGWSNKTFNVIDDIFDVAFPNDTIKNEIKTRVLNDISSGIHENMQWNEIEIQTEIGEKRIINAKSFPLINQDLVITAITDITETFNAYESVRKSNERFTYINKATNDAIFDWDIESGFIFRGEGYSRLFGFDHTKNKLSDWLDRIHPDDIQKVNKKLHEVLANKDLSIWTKEYRFLVYDTTYAEVMETGYIIRNLHGKAIRMIGAIRDITELKQAESELQETNTKLKEQTRELTLSNQELEQFAYIASHDLQEPLRMVSSFLSLLEKKYDDKIDEQGKRYIHFATDGAKRMRQIILDLLSFSRVGRIQSEVVELNLNELIYEINQLNQSLLFETKAEIHVGNLPTLHIPKSPMLQLFQNLISNAIKYRNHETTPIIHINAIELDKEWQFSVQDNGIGIEKEFYDKIFILFQRLHTRDKYEGTGVGLAICKKIVEQFGGKIWLESEQNIGTTFFFTLAKTIKN